MASFFCHTFAVTKQVRLERIVRAQLLAYLKQPSLIAKISRGGLDMADEPEWATRAQRADAIAQSAARLLWQCENNMPDTMIERERLNLLKKLITFPVDGNAMEFVVRADVLERMRETKCLDESGFFDRDDD